MSYRFEKNQNGEQELIFSGWEKGIADSPFVGIGNIVNCDIYGKPGAFRAQYKTEKVSGSNITALPKWIVQNQVTNDRYALDANGVVYKESSGWGVLAGNTLTGANGNGMAVFISQNDPTKTFILVARNAFIDVYDVAAATWTNGFQTLVSNLNYHPMFNFPDLKTYIGNKNLVASLAEKAGQTFAPGNAATYTWNGNALDLRAYYTIKSLSILNDMLAIGTYTGANPGDLNLADMFLWDTFSDTFNRIISFASQGVNMLINIANTIYAYIGVGAEIYATNGSLSQVFKRFKNIPFDELPGNITSPYPGAIENIGNAETLIGLSNIVAGLAPMGVYSIRDGVYSCRNLISTGATGLSSIVQIGSLLVQSRDVYLIGWRDGSNYGIDKVNGSGQRYDDLSSYIESDMVPVSVLQYPLTYREVEVRLGEPMPANTKVAVYFRANINSAYTQVALFDSVANPALVGQYMLRTSAGAINQVENLQIKTAVAGYSQSSPLVMEVRLRK